MNTLAFDSSFQSISPDQLDAIAGGVDWGKAVDAGNRAGNAGALIGGGVGTVVGAAAGGIPTAGIGALPGAAMGAGIGAGVGGGLGWVGGAATNLWNQARGR